MISIAFNGTAEEVTKEMRVFLAGFGALPTPATELKPTKTAEQPVEQTAKKPAEKSPPAEASVAPKSELPTDLLAEIKAIIPKLVKAKGRPAVVELLAEFGATSGGEIKDEDRVTFLGKAQSLLPE